MIKKGLEKMYINAATKNRSNIFGLLEKGDGITLLDLGCDDGKMTEEMGILTGSKKLYGVEIADDKIKICKTKGIKIYSEDLNKKLSYKSKSFDIIHANQVIEHLYDSDNFLSEIYRGLKPGGYAIISTENASSWSNIFASVMGWQIFSLTNFSGQKSSIGNPLSLSLNRDVWSPGWRHVRIYNYRGLKEYLESFNFKVEKIAGSGYFPLPAVLGNIDKRHCNFMTFKVRKK